MVLTLQPDFVSDVTIGLRDSVKLVVTFGILRIFYLPCYDLHRLTYLLSFADVTVRLLLYIILRLLVFADVTIGLPRWSSSWSTRLIDRVF